MNTTGAEQWSRYVYIVSPKYMCMDHCSAYNTCNVIYMHVLDMLEWDTLACANIQL